MLIIIWALPLLAWPTHHLLYSEMSRQDTIVSAPFTSRSTTKSPTESLQYFYLAPHNSQVPLQMSQTLLLSHHLVLRGPVSQRQTTPASIAPPITSVAYRFVVLYPNRFVKNYVVVF